MKSISDFLRNTTASGILQSITIHGQLTASEMSDLLKDVPRTTLYRYIRELNKASAIKVVREEKIRGQTERTFAISDEWQKSENSGDKGIRNANWNPYGSGINNAPVDDSFSIGPFTEMVLDLVSAVRKEFPDNKLYFFAMSCSHHPWGYRYHYSDQDGGRSCKFFRQSESDT